MLSDISENLSSCWCMWVFIDWLCCSDVNVSTAFASHLHTQRCRAGSVAECILMLDYLLYYCLPLPLLILTLAYVGLCSLLSKQFSVDILLASQEWLSSPSPSFPLFPSLWESPWASRSPWVECTSSEVATTHTVFTVFSTTARYWCLRAHMQVSTSDSVVKVFHLQ